MSPRQQHRRRKHQSPPKKNSRPPMKHIDVPVYMPPPPPVREYDPCPLSGEPIDNIYIAIAEPTSGKPARFDKVLESLTSQETMAAEQRIAYIGAGNFGIIENKVVKGKQHVELVKKIPYEDPYDKKPWQNELSLCISRDYMPNPEPLGDLYTREELKQFPKLGASAVSNITF